MTIYTVYFTPSLSFYEKDPCFPYLEMVQSAIVKIRTSYRGLTSPGYLEFPWSKINVDPNSVLFPELCKLYNSIPTKFHPALISLIWNKKEISKKEKMQFLIEVLKNDKSLTAEYFAGNYLSEESSIKWDPFIIKPFLDWWEQNKDTIKN